MFLHALSMPPLTPVGFELTQRALVELESTPLGPRRKISWWSCLSNKLLSPLVTKSCTINSISGLVVEYIVAIDVTRVRFPADAS